MPLLFQMGYKNEFDIHMAFHLIMAIMSAKFDEDVRSSFLFIVFTSLFSYISVVTLTFDLQNQ